jgi:beta-ribofuranosylaminobenzene 5'-phosphate synthase
MKIVVTIPARIHLTLVELGQRGYRRNGGIGFALNTPSRYLEFEPAPECDVAALSNLGFTANETDAIRAILDSIRKDKSFRHSIRILVAGGSGRHIGTGSGTGVTLACIEGLLQVNDARTDSEELIRLSGRGGTSGIGIHTYFAGGFVLDVGRKYDANPIESSDDVSAPTSVPKLLARATMPDWPMGILTPACQPLAIEQERAVFASLETQPLENSAVHEVAYHSVFGIAAAVSDADYESFCDAVNAIQKTAWKQREIQAYGQVVARTISRMRVLGCDCVALSSMGPTLFFLSAEIEDVLPVLRTEFPDARIERTMANNVGREIRRA